MKSWIPVLILVFSVFSTLQSRQADTVLAPRTALGLELHENFDGEPFVGSWGSGYDTWGDPQVQWTSFTLYPGGYYIYWESRNGGEVEYGSYVYDAATNYMTFYPEYDDNESDGPNGYSGNREKITVDGDVMTLGDAGEEYYTLARVGIGSSGENASGNFSESYFFPHIASKGKWETEVAVVNKESREIPGVWAAYNNQGGKVAEKSLTLPANGRRAVTIGDAFSNPENIGYVIFFCDSSTICGYTKFYQDGVFRVAVPAVQEVNTGDIYIPHVASNNTWWTGLALVNTMDTTKYVTITFNTGDSVGFSLRPGEHKQFSIKELFDDASQEEIAWGVLSDADGVIGLELFGAEKRLSGVLLRNECSETLYFPHVASNQTWWTGIAACKPGSAAAELTVKPYRKDGTALAELGAEIGAEGKYYGDAGDLGLPAETAWFAIEASRPLNGFELFGTTNADQLAGYSAVNIKRQQGVFPKLEAEGWTGIAFVNTAAGSAEVSLRLYQDDGTVAAEKTLPLAGHAKKVETGEALFSGAAAEGSYIAFSADTDVVGFQLNSSADNKMLDALPGM